jgi:hypothetical protein
LFADWRIKTLSPVAVPVGRAGVTAVVVADVVVPTAAGADIATYVTVPAVIELSVNATSCPPTAAVAAENVKATVPVDPADACLRDPSSAPLEEIAVLVEVRYSV